MLSSTAAVVADDAGVIVAFTNSKGGVGKSTLAVHLVAWLYRQGKRAALLDADVQGSAARWLSDAMPTVTVLPAHTPDEILGQRVADLVESHDVVVADGPAGLAEQTRALLMIADLALVPCGPSVVDLRAAALAVEVMQQARRVRGAGRGPAGLLVMNRVQMQTRLGREVVDAAAGLGLPVAQTVIRLRTAYADAAGQGVTVFELGSAAAEAAADLDALFREVMKDV